MFSRPHHHHQKNVLVFCGYTKNYFSTFIRGYFRPLFTSWKLVDGMHHWWHPYICLHPVFKVSSSKEHCFEVSSSFTGLFSFFLSFAVLMHIPLVQLDFFSLDPSWIWAISLLLCKFLCLKLLVHLFLTSNALLHELNVYFGWGVLTEYISALN